MKVDKKRIEVSTSKRFEIIDVTSLIQNAVRTSKIDSGVTIITR